MIKYAFGINVLIAALLLLLDCDDAMAYMSMNMSMNINMSYHSNIISRYGWRDATATMSTNTSTSTGTVASRYRRKPSYTLALKSQSGNDNEGEDIDTDTDTDTNTNMEGTTGIEEELERLQQTLTTIEALEERNKSQLESFIDEQDQWESMEEDERVLLRSKDEIVQRLDALTTELMQMWMGAKSMEG